MARERRSPAPDPVLLPPVRGAVTVRVGARDFGSLVLRRGGDGDYLDAPRRPDGVVPAVRAGDRVEVIWADGPRAYRVAARVDEVLEPVPGLIVRYEGPVQRINRRREARSAVHFAGRYREAGGTWYPTITRDGSPSGLRFFLHRPLPEGTRLEIRLQADGSEVEGRVVLLHLRPGTTSYLDGEGVDAVGLWEPPLEGQAAAVWRAALRRHQWDT